MSARSRANPWWGRRTLEERTPPLPEDWARRVSMTKEEGQRALAEMWAREIEAMDRYAAEFYRRAALIAFGEGPN